MKYCYCLFCVTSKCGKVASRLEKSGMLRAFSPQIIKRQRKNGNNIDLTYDLLPGYVFAYSEEVVQDVSVFSVDGVISVLKYSESNYCLKGNDLQFALALLEKNGVIDVMRVIRKGDIVSLIDTCFMGQKGMVVEIDCRKQRAKVEFSFSGMEFSTWVACEIIDAHSLDMFSDCKEKLQIDS